MQTSFANARILFFFLPTKYSVLSVSFAQWRGNLASRGGRSKMQRRLPLVPSTTYVAFPTSLPISSNTGVLSLKKSIHRKAQKQTIAKRKERTSEKQAVRREKKSKITVHCKLSCKHPPDLADFLDTAARQHSL